MKVLVFAGSLFVVAAVVFFITMTSYPSSGANSADTFESEALPAKRRPTSQFSERATAQSGRKAQEQQGFTGWASMTVGEMQEYFGQLAQEDPQFLLEIIAKGPSADSVDNPSEFYGLQMDVLRSILDTHSLDEVESLLASFVRSCRTDEYGLSCLKALSEVLGGRGAGIRADSLMLKELFSRDVGGSLAISYFRSYGEGHSAAEILDHAKSLPLSPLDRQDGILQAAVTMSGESPSEALKLLEEIPPSAVGGAYGKVLGDILENSPENFAALVSDLPDSVFSSVGFNPEFMRALGRPENAEILVGILSRIPLNEFNRSGFHSMIAEASKFSVSHSFELIDRFPDGPFKSSLIASSLRVPEISGASEALRLINKVPIHYRDQAAVEIFGALGESLADGEMRLSETQNFVESLPQQSQSDLTGDLVRVAASVNIEKAINIFEEYSGAGMSEPQMAVAGGIIAETLANRDPELAIDWLVDLPVPALAAGYDSLIRSWGNTDPDSASRWLQAQPSGPARNSGIRALIDLYKDVDPEFADAWAPLLAE
jgi:hypothetical protein